MLKLSVFTILHFAINICIAQQEITTGNLFTDTRDNKSYKTVTLGTQTWMAENLAFKADTGCWAFNNNNEFVAKNGYLYDASSAKKSCPIGWHLPSDEEWKTLELFWESKRMILIRPVGAENAKGICLRIKHNGIHLTMDGANPSAILVLIAWDLMQFLQGYVAPVTGCTN